MHTTSNEDKRKLLDAGRDPRIPKYDYQKPDYGTESAGPETEEDARENKDDLRKVIEKIRADREEESLPEPGMDPF